MGKMLGEKLSLLRAERGMTMPDLSRAAGISLSHIHRIEYGDREPSYKMLVKLAEILDINPNELNTIQMMDKGYNTDVSEGGTKEDVTDDPRDLEVIQKDLARRIEALTKPDAARLVRFMDAYFPYTEGGRRD